MSMWESFVKGYRDANPDPLPIWLGRVLGLWIKWVACTVVVVLTARALGVQV